MSNVVAFSGVQLPAVTNSLSTALRGLEKEVGGSGIAILKMSKTGEWVYGADQTEVQEGSRWAVNPFSFVHGFIAWGDGEVAGEVMVPITEPLPEQPPVPAGASGRGWEVQVGCGLKCTNGEDAGTEVRFATTSVGGKQAVHKLAIDLANQIDREPGKPVPVVLLEVSHYQHKKFGRIFTPEFKVVDWIAMDGPSKQEAAPAVEAAADTPPPAEPAPARRRRRIEA